MKIDLLHNKIVAECSTESFRAQLGAAINSHFCEKYGSEILGVQMYEDHLSSRFYDGKTFYYPLSVKTEQGVFAEWVCWTVKRGAFENDNPFKHTGKSHIDFIFPDFVPSEFTDRHTARYFDGAGAKLRIETPAPDYSVLSGRYSQCFVDMLSEKLPKIVEEAASVKGIAESGIEFAVVFAPETYMEHTSENVTYRRILLCDSGSAPRDLWIKWTRLDGEGAYSIADTPDEENIAFEIGEDVPQKIKEKEYRFLSGAGKDKYHSAMGRKHITEWREVIKRAVKKGELSKVEVAACNGASFVKIKPEKAPVAEVFGKSEIEEKPELNAAEEVSANEARADENDELDAILMQAKAIADGAFLGKEKEEEERFAYAANESAAFARSATSAAVITEDSFKPEEDEELAKAMEMARLALDSMDTADNAENEDGIFVEDEISAEGEDGILIEDEVTAEDELSIAEAKADEEPVIEEAEGDAENGGADAELEDDADEDRELEEMTRMALEALALARRQSEQDTFADQITDASEDEPSEEEDELADEEENFEIEELVDEEESLEIEELADEAEAYDGEEELSEDEEADFADEETDGEAELIGEDEAAPSVIVPMDPTEEEYIEVEDDELYAEALADARALEPDGELSADEKTPDAPESAFADSTSAPDIVKIREEIEAKVRLEYESQARRRAEEEAERLRREGEMLRKENERLLELARQSEAAKQLAEENHKNEKEQLKAQIEAGLRREAKERERLAEAARLATMEQQRAELEMIRAEQQRAEDEKARREAEARAEEERLAEEKRIREQKARREAEAKAAQIKNYTFTTKVVSLIFRKSVDPNLISRIEATIKATLEYLGKQSVPMKIKATIPNSNMVRLEFREFPEQEMELLGSIVKIMGNNNLGIAKAIIE